MGWPLFHSLQGRDMAVRQIVGKRLTYKELTGKEGSAAEPF